MNPLIPLFVGIPLAGAFLTMILGYIKRNACKYFTTVILLLLASLSIVSLINIHSFADVYKVGGWEPVNGIPIGIYMVLDCFSIIVLCIINLIGFLASFYSISYIKRYTSEHYYYSLFCLIIAGMNGVVLSGDIFNIFVFLEVSVISSYALVAFGVGKQELEASFKYQMLGDIALFLILVSIGLIYWHTKTLNMADIREIFRSGYDRNFYFFTQLLILSGFGIKAAIIPFHAWLPDAHSSAPSPISAMLSGVLIKAAGIYIIIRLSFNMFVITREIGIILMSLGTLSMAGGVVLAIGQWDIKRLLAYHSISQMGYVIMSMGIGMTLLAKGIKYEVAVLAVTGGLFHLINHAVFKSLLFLNAGAIEYRTATRNLRKMGGLSRLMPVTSSTSFIASMSISGVPPFNGFFSKLIIIIAAVLAGYYLLAIFAVIVSILTLASFLKFQKYAFFRSTGSNKTGEIKEVPAPMMISMIILGLMCIGLSLLVIPILRENILIPAVRVLVDPDYYSSLVPGI